MYFVYILRCGDYRLYVGCTNNLRNRILYHQKGYCEYTKKHLPIKLIFFSCFANKYLAFNFERYLKTGSGRAFLNKRLVRVDKRK